MGILKRLRKKNEVLNVATTKETDSLNSDRNNDGIPDYIQRSWIPSVISSNKDLNQWEADVEKEVEEWIMGLRGYEFDAETNGYVPKSPPIMNEIGISKLKTHLKSIVNKHGINTGLKPDEVHEIVKSQVKSLIKWLKYNVRKCGISYSDLTPIVDEFDNFAFLVLSRSINDSQRDHVTKRTSLTGSLNNRPEKQAI